MSVFVLLELPGDSVVVSDIHERDITFAAVVHERLEQILAGLGLRVILVEDPDFDFREMVEKVAELFPEIRVLTEEEKGELDAPGELVVFRRATPAIEQTFQRERTDWQEWASLQVRVIQGDRAAKNELRARTKLWMKEILGLDLPDELYEHSPEGAEMLEQDEP